MPGSSLEGWSTEDRRAAWRSLSQSVTTVLRVRQGLERAALGRPLYRHDSLLAGDARTVIEGLVGARV
jgi:hypothetical protein